MVDAVVDAMVDVMVDANSEEPRWRDVSGLKRATATLARLPRIRHSKLKAIDTVGERHSQKFKILDSVEEVEGKGGEYVVL